MRSFVSFGGGGSGSFIGKLMLVVLVLLGLVILFFFFFALLAVLVISLPVGLVVYVLKRVFFPRQKQQEEPKMQAPEKTRDTEIIDVTDFETVEEDKRKLKA